jgi:hypothetical protein
MVGGASLFLIMPTINPRIDATAKKFFFWGSRRVFLFLSFF